MAKMDRPSTGYLAEAHRFKAPGPGNYNSGGSLGKQTSSTKTSSAYMKFSVAPREQQALTYMPDLQQEGSSRLTPGPGTYAPISHNSISRKSGKKKAPVYSFGGNLAKVKREGLAGKTATLAGCGPGSYGAKESVGSQVSSLKRTAPRANFGTADRTKSEVAVQPGYAGKSKGVADNPGPGSYSHNSSMSKQADAKKPSSFAFKFGTENRSKAEERANRDKFSTPGPGAYNDSPGAGFQVNSRHRTSQRTLFGTSNRGDLATPVG